MLDLDSAFAKLRDKEDQDAAAAQAEKNRIDEVIRGYANECQRALGGLGIVEIKREAKGVMLNAGAKGWLMIVPSALGKTEIRIGKKASNSIPPDANIHQVVCNDDSEISEAIARWYMGVARPG